MKLNMAAKFCHRMAVGHKAGVDMINLLASEAAQGPSHHQAAIKQLSQDVMNGDQLFQAMDKQGAYFPRLVIAMTEVGEESGKLERAWFILSQHLENRLTTRRNFIRSLAWPGFQMMAGVCILSLIIWLLGILTPAGGGEMTDILGLGLRGTNGVLKFWGFLAIIFGVIGLFVAAFVRNWFGVQNLAPLIYAIPKVGPAIQTITIARFCHAMALALEAGLDPFRALRLALDSTGSDYYREAAQTAEKSIREGSTLAQALTATRVFPAEFVARVEASEYSGTDAETMHHLAKDYDQRAETAVKVLSMIATFVVRFTMALILVFFIVRIAMVYIGAVNDAFEPINKPRGRR